MKFEKNNDESWQLVFNDDEINILSKKKKLIFTPLAFRHFGNNLMNLCAEMLKNQEGDVNTTLTYSKEIDINDKSRK